MLNLGLKVLEMNWLFLLVVMSFSVVEICNGGAEVETTDWNGPGLEKNC